LRGPKVLLSLLPLPPENPDWGLKGTSFWTQVGPKLGPTAPILKPDAVGREFAFPPLPAYDYYPEETEYRSIDPDDSVDLTRLMH
jgi:hypothetical protein